MGTRRKVAGAIWSLLFHEVWLVPVPIYGSEIMIWKEKERFRIMAVQMGTSEVC